MSPQQSMSPTSAEPLGLPERVRFWRTVEPGDPGRAAASREGGLGWEADGVRLGLRAAPGGAWDVELAAPEGPVACAAVTWRLPDPIGPRSLVLGDAFERSYGDVCWRPAGERRPLPWYWLADHGGGRTGMGVATGPSALCTWTLEPSGGPNAPAEATLWLDVRSGTAPSRPGPRVIPAARVVAWRGAEEPFDALGALVGALGPAGGPLPVPHPLVGGNNWYYAYGEGFDAGAVLRDADTLAELAGGHAERPYCVVDDGWQAGGQGAGGPWGAGLDGAFPDLPGLTAELRGRGTRPGVWFRPLLRRAGDPVARTAPDGGAAPVLDPSLPEHLELVAADVRRLTGLGFELLKHDFSTYDLLGFFGALPPRPGAAEAAPRALADGSRTTAEALTALYRTIREAAGDAVVLGCNTVGHLAAGLVQAQRTGDDTSGREWRRTRTMGVNTLAFRLPQHGRLFAVDADCVPCTPHTPWPKNRQFLDAVARSGTALFVSVDPASRTRAVDRELAAALRLALDGGEPGSVRPLDWQHSPAPSRWRSASGIREYVW